MRKAWVAAVFFFSLVRIFSAGPALGTEADTAPLPQNGSAAQNTKPDMSAEQYEKLAEALNNGTSDDLRKFLKSGFNVNSVYNCHTPLQMSIRSLAFALGAPTSKVSPDEAFEKIKIIIEAGADVNDETCSTLPVLPLMAAMYIPFEIDILEKTFYTSIVGMVRSGSVPQSCLPLFGKSCSDVTQDDLDLLKYKIGKSYKEIYAQAMPYVMKTLSLLVENGANVNAQTSDGKTIIATSLLGFKIKNLEPLKYLISMGADVNIRDKDGNTPLFFASGNGDKEAVKILLEAGADERLWNNSGLRYNEVISKSKRTYLDPNEGIKTEYEED